MDTTLHSRLGLDAGGGPRDAPWRVLERVRRAGGRAALLWHNTYLADDRAPGYGRACGATCSTSSPARGADLGPAGRRGAAAGGRLAGRAADRPPDLGPPPARRAHLPQGGAAAAAAGGRARGWARRASRSARARRLAAGLAPGAARRGSATPTSTTSTTPSCCRRPCGWRAAAGGRWSTTPTSTWARPPAPSAGSPARCGFPSPSASERAERAAARRLAAVVAANEDLAARFAAAGARAVSVTNSPWSDAFPEPAAHARSTRSRSTSAGSGPLRGLEVMRAAFPLVGRARARAWCSPARASPATCRPGAESIGPVDHSRVPALLAAARVAWVPLQRHGNYDRAVPTKLVEAMAAGRPVVASDLGRMGAIVREAGCGLVVPPDDRRAHAAGARAPALRRRRRRAHGRRRPRGLRRGPGLRGPGARALTGSLYDRRAESGRAEESP